jgi:hypothetical protein
VNPGHECHLGTGGRGDRASQRRRRLPAGFFQLDALEAGQQFVADLLALATIGFNLPRLGQFFALRDHPPAQRDQRQTRKDEGEHEQ